MAERVGFEPTIPGGYTAFRERRLQPLGHLSTCLDYGLPVAWFDGQAVPWLQHILKRLVASRRTAGSSSIWIRRQKGFQLLYGLVGLTSLLPANIRH